MDGWVGVVHPGVAEVGVIEEVHVVEEATQVSIKSKMLFYLLPHAQIAFVSNYKCITFRLQ